MQLQQLVRMRGQRSWPALSDISKDLRHDEKAVCPSDGRSCSIKGKGNGRSTHGAVHVERLAP